MRKILPRNGLIMLSYDRRFTYSDGTSPVWRDPNPMPRFRLFRWLP